MASRRHLFTPNSIAPALGLATTGHREVPAAEARMNGKVRSQHSPQPNPLFLLLLHDHNSKAWCHCGHGEAHSPLEDIARTACGEAYGAYGMAARRGSGRKFW